MIISASRRTDIPAFYAEWFVNRLQEGFVYIKNPMNAKQISKVPLNTEVVDCIVFWTKNVQPMIRQLDTIDSMGYPYYFQFSITPYGSQVEKHLINKDEIIKGFKILSDRIGKQRVIWRYDPVIINDSYPVEYHLDAFHKLCGSLRDYTNKCIFSYVDLYTKGRGCAKKIEISQVSYENMHRIAQGFSEIAKNNIMLETCAEEINLKQYGIGQAACIDKKVIEDIIGYSIHARKDQNQREQCNCIASIDVGAYDSCPHGCTYCYATSNQNAVYKNMQLHDVRSPLLIGKPLTEGKIKSRDVTSSKIIQNLLF